MSSRFAALSVCLLASILLAAGAAAQMLGPGGWSVLQGANGLAVEYPAELFSVGAGPTEKGEGRKFKSSDGRFEFAAYSLANTDKDSPGRYLRKNLIVPPESLIYRRVTEQFFVMSSIRDGRIFYSRCNFAGGIHCIYLEYPQEEKRAWDPIVTRVSYSLRPR